MAFRITPEWVIDLADDFEHRVENEKLVFWKTGITVVNAAFHLPAGTDKLALLAQIQEKIPDDVLEKLVSTKGEIVGLGYTRIEKRAGAKDRLALYTFTASQTSFLQSAFYLDDPEDLAWAKNVWETLIYLPPNPVNLDRDTNQPS